MTVHRFVFALTLLAPSVFAQTATWTTAKPPWVWTVEERIAARLDPVAIEQRSARHAASLRGHDGTVHSQTSATTTSTHVVIDGNVNPELFLPFELFNTLLGGVDPQLPVREREISQAMLNSRIHELGYDPKQFWTDLSEIAAGYYAVRDRKVHLPPSRGVQTSDQEQTRTTSIAMCRARFDALSAARAKYGTATFDRFLYTVVPPGLLSGSNMPGPDEASGLLYIERGCQ